MRGRVSVGCAGFIFDFFSRQCVADTEDKTNKKEAELRNSKRWSSESSLTKRKTWGSLGKFEVHQNSTITQKIKSMNAMM